MSSVNVSSLSLARLSGLLSVKRTNCPRAIPGAYRATLIRNLEVEVRVPSLGIHLDSIQARFRVRAEESEVAGVIKEAVEEVER